MGERERLVANLGAYLHASWTNQSPPTQSPQLPPNIGEKNVMILRNHGLLVAGGDVARAFFYYYSVQRACEVGLLSASCYLSQRESKPARVNHTTPRRLPPPTGRITSHSTTTQTIPLNNTTNRSSAPRGRSRDPTCPSPRTSPGARWRAPRPPTRRGSFTGALGWVVWDLWDVWLGVGWPSGC